MDKAAEPAKKPDEKAALAQFFELKKQGYSRCLHGALDCKNEPVKAHSIQNGKVLDLLQKDNHVIFPQIELDLKTGPVLELKSLGRNKASTFTGLCSEHDNELFKLADTIPLDTSNMEQLEQYAYRAVMKEFHTCVEQSDRFFVLEQDYIKKGFIKPNTPNGAAEAAIAFAAKAQDVFRYRTKHFDLPKLDGDPQELNRYKIYVGMMLTAYDEIISLDFGPEWIAAFRFDLPDHMEYLCEVTSPLYWASFQEQTRTLVESEKKLGCARFEAQ
jgi:hypothetical protein